MSSEIVKYEPAALDKANILISAKYRASLLELKVTYACMFKLQNDGFERKPDGIHVRIGAGELRSIINANSGSFYKNLLPVARSMTSRSFGITNPDTKEFDFIALITEASYKDGIFEVIFNLKLEKFLTALQNNYTSLPRELIMSLNSNYAFRLYELLKKSCFYRKNYTGERNGRFLVEISLAELKLDLGVVNSELDSVQRVLSGSEIPNYERAVSASPERLYESWSEFRRRCLDKPIEEINEKTDINVSYDTQRVGRGGKVHSVSFKVYVPKLDETGTKKPETDRNGEAYLNDQDKFAFLLSINELFKSYKINYADIVTISEEADFNYDRLKELSDYMTTQTISNPVGWILSALQNGWSIPEQRKIKFNNFLQREYDMTNLEKELLSYTHDESNNN